ncbi:hypothetical protein [Zooshikella ganghwensis]|nr:hypothetical protein [Zooshikella ganghwensis]
MKLETRIKQSSVRVKSNLKLGMFFLVCALGALLWGPAWLAKVCGAIAGLACLGAGVEYWNAERLKKQKAI